MNYLVTIWDAVGSVPPELALARRLVTAGHRVVAIAGPPLQPAVQAAGGTFRSWQHVPHRRHPSEPEPFDDSDLSGPPQIAQMMLDRLIAGPRATTPPKSGPRSTGSDPTRWSPACTCSGAWPPPKPAARHSPRCCPPAT